MKSTLNDISLPLGYKYKISGYVITIIGLLILFIYPSYTITIVNVGFLLINFSKEKIESPKIALARFQSFKILLLTVIIVSISISILQLLGLIDEINLQPSEYALIYNILLYLLFLIFKLKTQKI